MPAPSSFVKVGVPFDASGGLGVEVRANEEPELTTGELKRLPSLLLEEGGL